MEQESRSSLEEMAKIDAEYTEKGYTKGRNGEMKMDRIVGMVKDHYSRRCESLEQLKNNGTTI